MAMDPLSRYRHEAPHLAPDTAGVARAAVPARWGRASDGPDSAAGTGAVSYHTASAGETFESLSVRFLGSSTLWWRIADLNPLVFPLSLVPGTVVAIPGSGTVAGPVRTRNW
ncbi:MAG: LysM peptidoglycan-binding domain-containing protein [Acidimicrobiia bacterium]|nr:LysM peptidoglycan-binding domain-containing protein [Acidimicrobiia bacterium]